LGEIEGHPSMVAVSTVLARHLAMFGVYARSRRRWGRTHGGRAVSPHQEFSREQVNPRAFALRPRELLSSGTTEPTPFRSTASKRRPRSSGE